MKKLIFLVTAFTILALSMTLATGEPADVTQMYRDCINSGGRAASNYNAWVAQNGCICPGSSTGSGQRNCSGTSNSGGPGVNFSPEMFGGGVQGAAKSGFMNGFINTLSQPSQPSNGEAERQAQEAEQQRQADEQRRTEEMRHQEIAKQRILGMLKDTSPTPVLQLKTGGSADAPLQLKGVSSDFNTTALVPINNVPGSGNGNDLQLKLGDDAEKSSVEAGQGFDTAGKIMGSNLPPPPPTPSSISPAKKAQVLNALRSKLKKSEAEEQSLKNQLAQLRQAPTPDPVTISQVQNKLNEVTSTNTQLTQNIEKVTAGESNIGFEEEEPTDKKSTAVSPSQ